MPEIINSYSSHHGTFLILRARSIASTFFCVAFISVYFQIYASNEYVLELDHGTASTPRFMRQAGQKIRRFDDGFEDTISRQPTQSKMRFLFRV